MTAAASICAEPVTCCWMVTLSLSLCAALHVGLPFEKSVIVHK